MLEGAAVMLDYRRIALWVAVLLVPGGFLFLPLLIAYSRRQRAVSKSGSEVPQGGPKAPNDGPDSNRGSPDDGPTPQLAA